MARWALGTHWPVLTIYKGYCPKLTTSSNQVAHFFEITRFVAAGSDTTGNRGFAECFLLCRVPNVVHSAKIDFAECRTRQSQTLGISIFAECQAKYNTRQSLPLSSVGLSAKLNTRQRLTEVTAATHRQALPSGRRQTLGKEFFKFFLIFCLFSLPSALSLALGKDPLCRVPGLALGKEFFFIFAPRFFLQSCYSALKYMLKFG